MLKWKTFLPEVWLGQWIYKIHKITIGTKNGNHNAIILQVSWPNPYNALVLYIKRRVKLVVKWKAFLPEVWHCRWVYQERKMTIETKNENHKAIILLVSWHNPYNALVLYVKRRVKLVVKRKTFLPELRFDLVSDLLGI
jgi:hypothetical protein